MSGRCERGVLPRFAFQPNGAKEPFCRCVFSCPLSPLSLHLSFLFLIPSSQQPPKLNNHSTTHRERRNMSDDNTNATGAGATSVDPVHQLLQSSNNGQPMTAEQRNERREALLKRQKESREKAQQISQAAKANAIASTSTSAPASTPAPSSSPATPPATTAPVTSVAPVAPVVSDAPIRENMVQQAVSFLSSPSVQSADEAKKTQFLEKKGLTLKEIELARSRVTGGASGSVSPLSQTHPKKKKKALGSK